MKFQPRPFKGRFTPLHHHFARSSRVPVRLCRSGPGTTTFRYIHGLRLCKPASSGHCSPTTSVEYRPPPVVGRWWAHLICMLAVAGPAGTRLHAGNAAAAVAAFVHDATSDRPRHVPVHHGTRAPWELCTSDCPYFWAVPCCANSWP